MSRISQVCQTLSSILDLLYIYIYKAPSFITDEFYCTVGCHPTRCSEFEQNGESQYFSGLRELATAHRGKVVAIGECGLGVYCLRCCSHKKNKSFLFFKFLSTRNESLAFPPLNVLLTLWSMQTVCSLR